MVQFLAFLSLCMFLVFPLSGNQTDERQKHTLNLMPMPENVAVNDGFYPLTEDFSVSLDNRGGRSSERISKAISRFLHRLSGRTGLCFKTHEIGAGIPTGGKSNQTGLTVSFQRTGEVKLGEEESYTLTIDNTGIRLEAVTDIGAMHGIETLLQYLRRLYHHARLRASSVVRGLPAPQCKIRRAQWWHLRRRTRGGHAHGL